MRIIDILNDDAEYQQLSLEDLPLAVILSDSENNIIKILPVDVEEEKNTGLVLAYIAQQDDHFFFQIAENNNNTLFHNDEIIEKSVWLKSGDIVQIKDKIILYTVSGDKIKLSISEKIERPVSKELLGKKSIIENNTSLVRNGSNVKNKSYLKNKITFVIFFLLIIISGFVLFSETAEINIKPEADTIELNGLFPVVSLGNRFILLPGDYKLQVKKEGYRDLDKRLTINADNNIFSFTIKENPGKVKFIISPADNNKISIDNIIVDKKENTAYYEIDKGAHQLTIHNPRYKSYQQIITIEGKNKQQKYTIALQPDWGYITLQSVQQESQLAIYANNRKEKQVVSQLLNTKTDIELMSGSYTIEVSKDKFKTYKQSISINAGDNLILNTIDLEPEDGFLKLTSQPDHSIIRIDGHYKGKTPQTIKLSSYKEHKIELSLNGYKTMTKVVSLQPEIEHKETFRLFANSGLIFVSTSPAHAVLSIDGKKQKNNSGDFNLTAANHLFSVKAKGYQSQSKKISINNYSKNISFILQKKSYKKKLIKQNINYTNSIGQRMLRIKPAIFTMGAKRGEAGRRGNEYHHTVELTYAYFLSDKEITNKQYRQYNSAHNSGSDSGQSLNLDNQPVVNISWQEAAKFANWLSHKESLSPYYKEENGKLVPVDLKARINGYRLPFEAEWSLAARGLHNSKYPWKGNYPPTLPSGNFSDSSVKKNVNKLTAYNDNYSVTAPVGSYAKNPLGFYDLGGNVSEWCQDYYSPVFNHKKSINLTGPKHGTHKVVKDASWRDSAITELRFSYRNYSKKKANDIGFRLARYAQ